MKEERKQQIEQLLKAYHERGKMTRQQFCESRGMTDSAFDYYLRTYGKAKPTVKLAKVQVTPATSQSTTWFRLVLGNGRQIECGESGLAQLIRAAEKV